MNTSRGISGEHPTTTLTNWWCHP